MARDYSIFTSRGWTPAEIFPKGAFKKSRTKRSLVQQIACILTILYATKLGTPYSEAYDNQYLCSE
jgi:hypothetical protein